MRYLVICLLLGGCAEVGIAFNAWQGAQAVFSVYQMPPAKND
jgi:hypothetical protein